MTPTDLSVIVIGAGSSGLLLAQGLKQKGIKVNVYEREDSTAYQTRPREWGMTIHWSGENIMTCIPPDLRAGFKDAVCTDPVNADTSPIFSQFNGQTGEKMVDTVGKQLRRVSRKKLREFLSQGIDVEYGKKLATIETAEDGKATAFFADGSSVSASCIIGCDGAKSAVRRCLVGEEASKMNDNDIHLFNVCYTLPRETSLLVRSLGGPVLKNSYHPDGFMWLMAAQRVEDLDRPETWLWQNLFTWQGAPRKPDLPDHASRRKFWREQGEKYAEPWRSVARALPDNIQFPVDKISTWAPVDWSELPLAGLVTLVGDAAHPLPPHRGQGLNIALEDAAKLVDQLSLAWEGTKTLAVALKDYADEMIPRGRAEVAISTRQARMAHDFDQLIESPMFKMGLDRSAAEPVNNGAMGATVA